jgi:hypothetical protein
MQVDDASGDVLTVFTDYSVVAAHAKGEVFFQGHIAGQSAASLMIVGQDTDGNQYMFSNDDAIGLTVDGDVFLGSGDHLYFYDYDENRNFVSLTDSEGHKYDVETAANGDTTITDAVGDIGDFNPDGSYNIKDPAGDVLDQGALFGENDGDPVSSLDAGGDATLTPDAEATEGSLDANSSGEANATIAPDNGSDVSSPDANSSGEANATLALDNGAATESPDASSGDTSGEG